MFQSLFSSVRRRLWLQRCVLLLLPVVLGASLITIAGFRDHIGPADVLIVPGNKINPDGQPARVLQYRLLKALELYRLGYAPMIIVSGGIGKEGFDEAAVMARFLTEQGVPAAHIIIDPQGINTLETARFAARWMHEHGKHRALLVSQFYHLPRFKLAMERQGIAELGQAHSKGVAFLSLIREVVGYVAYWLVLK